MFPFLNIKYNFTTDSLFSMCLPIIIFHTNFSQDPFFWLRRFFLLGVTVVGLRHFGLPWCISHHAFHSHGCPCQRCACWASLGWLGWLGWVPSSFQEAEATLWWLTDVVEQQWQWRWQLDNPMDGLGELWVTWMNFEWLGSLKFFQTLKVDVFLGTQQTSFWGEFGEVLGVSFFFSQKWDFGSSLKVEDLWLVGIGVFGDCWSICLMRFLFQ